MALLKPTIIYIMYNYKKDNHLVDAGGAGKLLELGSRDAKPLAALMALAADFKDGFNGVVRCLKLPEI